ncbi:Bacterial alpha-L-rhamnosidase family protein [Clavispora lusitaniae]|uniref:Bacterial alpha-L-rhamnosidase family protein n=1 Tax=Clavispora lusitaniae TaxID=36911 RepID=UPI00202C37D4|nr:Bacterial alpha-L-rhamnosidase family protein [Clavispora lusitaniae]
MKVENIRLDLTLPGPLQGTLNTTRPSVSWKTVGDEKNWFQHGYQIRVRYNNENWTEYEEQMSERSTFVSWPGRDLRSRETFEVSVRVKGPAGFSDWSAPVLGQVGFLAGQEKWPAAFIAAKNQPRADGPTAPETLFRKTFSVSKKVVSATVWSTALGIYELEINGKKVGSDYLSPGWTTYEKRLLHQTYDVTTLIDENVHENVIGARVGAGWYSGKFGFDGGLTNIYGEKRAISAVLRLVFEDNSSVEIVSDNSWQSSPGPIVAAGLYDGESYDANREIPGWSSAAENGVDSWAGVDVVPFETSRIEPQTFPHVTVQRKISPKQIFTTPKGKTVVDFGENIVGFVEFQNATAPKGYQIQFKHAEVMEHGELGTRPLREAKATDTYTFKGEKSGESYAPRFTFHGFRYCLVEDVSRALSLEDLRAVVISTNMAQTGEFSCDNDLLNQLHDNVIRSTRGNFITLPTDCPQRDERMGWTGDIALFGQTAAFLFDCSSMLSSWLKDFWCEQELKADSKFPYAPPVTVPNVIKYMKHFWDDQISAIWQDCAVFLPKKLYDSIGATFVLADQYESMEKWIECIPKIPGKVRWNKEKVPHQLGDWLDPEAPPENPFQALTSAYLVADAFLYQVLCYMTEISAQVAPQNKEKYATMAAQCKSDFHDAYIESSGQLSSDSQTAYALVICFGLYKTSEQVEYGGKRLAAIVEKNGFKIGTGFAGTPFVTKALATTGHLASAYSMLLQKECPSWLYPVSMGATTIWERWDSMKPDGSINPGEMTSFNHYALGAVASTMHEVIGGLELVSPGYKEFKVKPQVGGDLKRCRVSHECPYGTIVSSWKIEDGKFSLDVTVPLNTRATIELPDGTQSETGSGVYSFECKA